ncbi:hypothetical protein K457DRAFT_1869972 [Linnemannia elongata AG-77]|uniref:Uncharacterized protein n=1 Tax=Linnemannia elongata AG-77 TaxID=1314771 RepID=A0A197KE81_9FUNG|nr:hypothetical protein K457DRAFT_1869972 [Linnemannia elongata AG-77]
MAPILKLILSASLATLATFTHAALAHAPPTHTDACGILGGLNATAVTYKHGRLFVAGDSGGDVEGGCCCFLEVT